jgi:hypothetical protein
MVTLGDVAADAAVLDSSIPTGTTTGATSVHYYWGR